MALLEDLAVDTQAIQESSRRQIAPPVFQWDNIGIIAVTQARARQYKTCCDKILGASVKLRLGQTALAQVDESLAALTDDENTSSVVVLGAKNATQHTRTTL